MSQVYWLAVLLLTLHLFFLSSLASSHCRPCEAQNSPQVFGMMSSKSITAEQFENAVQILPFLTSVQRPGLHGVVLDVGVTVGVRDGGGVGCGYWGEAVGCDAIGDAVGVGVHVGASVAVGSE